MQRRPDAAALFKQLLNPLDAKHGTQLVTVHGEHVPGGKKTDDHGIKFVLSFLASSGTVNWANDEVNQNALEQYNTILENEGFAPYKAAIISGDESLLLSIHTSITPPPTLDELYLALAFRVSVELEFIDHEHLKSDQTEYKIRNARSLGEMLMIRDPETGFTNSDKSRQRNFSTTLPVYSSKSSTPHSKSGFVEPMIIEQLMSIMRLPFTEITKDIVTLKKLGDFVALTRKHGIVLPTKDYLEKRYSLTARYGENENEHESFKTKEDGTIEEKGYEHKLCLFIPYAGTEDDYATHITSFNSPRPHIADTTAHTPAIRHAPGRVPVSKVKYTFTNTMHDEIIGDPANIPTRLQTEFTTASKEWNKCVIAPKDHAGDIGFFQWKIYNLGGVSHLVINIWNLISRLEGTMGTMAGGILVSTTSETLQMCSLLGLEYVTGIDLTCVVPGMRTAGWVVLDRLSWDEEVRDIDSQIAHVHFISVSDRTRHHVSAKAIRHNIHNQLDSVNKILNMFNATGDDANKIGTIVDATLKKTRHGTKYVHDEMFTMYYFFKGITKGPERTHLVAKPPDSVLVPILDHLTKIEEILSSYDSATITEKASMMTEYKEHLRGILTRVKEKKITIETFKLKPESAEIGEYIALVNDFIKIPKVLKEFFLLPNKLQEFTENVESRLVVLGETTEKIKKFIDKINTRVVSSKHGGKRNTTRKHRHHLKRRMTRRIRGSRSSRRIRKRMHTRRRR